MKIRTDFITNSSSSAFVVLKDSEYYKKLQEHEDFHFKEGDDITRCTGVYQNKHLLHLITSEWNDHMFEAIYPLIFKYGLENLALVMISDEWMGGHFAPPEEKDTLFYTEYH